ncbi:MAG TPA: [FeFe] hydrogenase H-cluster radical SAM maturase HydG [Candidatus Omnitrophota bacterium]|nr:[FeFe] hydrogenase H-cluster radical SAM maturase HydG [Candidatus Omnitrophota bacterium]HPS37672.1 [FeFe] hydrogenase H-cluster radical SAM maturase HydG [Candidatus Omnitrophota bacterium]
MGTEKAWIAGRIKQDQIDRYLDAGRDFIDDAAIWRGIEQAPEPDIARVREILAKSLQVKTLSPEELAELIQVQDPAVLQEMQETALRIKKQVYDNRIVTFAPLYMGNYCVNNCTYCGFKHENLNAKRRILSMEEVRKETESLAGKIGHKRIIAVYGEHPLTGIDYIVESMKTIYDVKVSTKHGYGNIRRINVNAAPMSIEELKLLKEVGLGTYQVFQETYHHETYAKLHPKGTLKSDYRWRLYAMHRALEAETGIDDVGIGVLFGLYDWRFEVMALLHHAIHLEAKMGIGPHTVSFPRLEPALNSDYAAHSPYRVSDEDFKKIILLIRLAIPYTGMIITARETAQMRRDALSLGVTQTDASTKLGIGSYSEEKNVQTQDRQQFILGDTRSLDELVRDFAEMGYITSFCTAGYRCGRTGKCIMELLRSGKEGKFCKLNAVLTFQEWLDDFATPETREIGLKVMEREIEEIRKNNPQGFPAFYQFLERVRKGERDLFL